MTQHVGGGGPGWSSLVRAGVAGVGQVENLTQVARQVCNRTYIARPLLLATLLVLSTRAAGDPLDYLGNPPQRGSTSMHAAPSAASSMALAAPVEAEATELAGSRAGSEPKTLRRGGSGSKSGQRSALRPRSPRRVGPFGDRVDSSKDLSAPWYRSVLGSLAIVLLAMGAVYWFLKRWLPGTRLSESQVLRVVARTTLSPKHGVALVQLGRRFVMVGTSPDSVTVLSEITDPEEVADLAARTGLGSARRGTGFEDLLSKEATGYRTPDRAVKDKPRFGKAGASHKRPATQGLTDLLDRLRTLRST